MTRKDQPHLGRPRRFADRGAGLVEYALLVALIAIVCLGALVYFGTSSNNNVTHSKDCIVNAGVGPAC